MNNYSFISEEIHLDGETFYSTKRGLIIHTSKPNSEHDQIEAAVHI